jgi:hypothetical protein
LNDPDQYYNDGDDQQNMNESTTHMTKKSQQPQNQENHTYGPKHVRLLSDDKMRPSISIYFWGDLKHPPTPSLLYHFNFFPTRLRDWKTTGSITPSTYRLFTSLPFGSLSLDPLSSIADSPE